MSESELKPDTIILGERNYAAALDLVVCHASKELLIFDQDFVRGDFSSLQRHTLLDSFLSNSPLSKLTVILQKTDYFMNSCPHLFALLKIYGHKMTVYTTNETAKIAKDCFVIADGKHYIRRFHIEQARFKYNMHDEIEATNLKMRFDELLEETTETVSATKLGL